MIKFIYFHILKGEIQKTSFLRSILYKISELKKAILIYCDMESNSSSFFKENIKYELSDCLQISHNEIKYSVLWLQKSKERI